MICLFLPAVAFAAPALASSDHPILQALPFSLGDVNRDGRTERATVNQRRAVIQITADDQPGTVLQEFTLQPGDMVTRLESRIVPDSPGPLLVAQIHDRQGRRLTRIYSYRSNTPIQIIEGE